MKVPVTVAALESIRRDYTEAAFEGWFAQYNVPLSLRESLVHYIREGVPTGGFLRAVLENDLVDAAQRADLDNRPHLASIALFLRSVLPMGAWGSETQVDMWLAAHRERRRAERASA